MPESGAASATSDSARRLLAAEPASTKPPPAAAWPRPDSRRVRLEEGIVAIRHSYSLESAADRPELQGQSRKLAGDVHRDAAGVLELVPQLVMFESRAQ